MSRKSTLLILGTLFLATLCTSRQSNAQLARDWTYDLTSLGSIPIFETAIYQTSPVIVDDSGNTYVAHYAKSPETGIRVTKIKNDSTIDWSTLHTTTKYIHYFDRSPTGCLYIMAGDSSLFYVRNLLFLKFNPDGNLAWSHTYSDPDLTNTDWFGGGLVPRIDIDIEDNLWFSTIASPLDSFCYSNNNGVAQYHATHVKLNKLSSLGGDKQTVNNMSSDVRVKAGGSPKVFCTSDGIANYFPYYIDYCLDDTCAYMDCEFTDRENNPVSTETKTYHKKFTNAGSVIDSTLIDVSDDNYEYTYHKGRNRQLYRANHYRTFESYDPADPSNVVNTSYTKIGNWTSPAIPNYYVAQYPQIDEQGNVLAELTRWGVPDDGSFNPPVQIMFDANTGAQKWSNYFDSYFLDRHGDTYGYLIEGRFVRLASDGTEIWEMDENKPLGAPISVDTSNSLYMLKYPNTLIRYVDKIKYIIHDNNGDLVNSTELDVIRINNDPPLFSEDTLGSIYTDINGEILLTWDDSLNWKIDLVDSTAGLNQGDRLKLSKRMRSVPSVRHANILGTMYSIHLDNAQFNEDGVMEFPIIGEASEVEVFLNHTEVRYNLVVSLEWDADPEYHQGLRADMEAMANYLYDVTDGQLRLDTVRIFDDMAYWLDADIRIRATNIHNPDAVPDGIYWNSVYPINMPRKWYGNSDDSRQGTFVDHPLTNALDNDYRTKAHEFGHFALGFFDEYVFEDDAGNNLGDGARCQPLPAGNYGFMDFQYDYWYGGVHASEMSSQYRYANGLCQNTAQFMRNATSCWEFFESRFEQSVDGLLVPILKPDLVDDRERPLTGGLDYFVGPNNDVLVLNYDVGSLIAFPDPVEAPAPLVSSRLISVSNVPVGGVSVTLDKDDGTGQITQVIDQGFTTDSGLIWVLGGNTTYDIVKASGNTWTYTASLSQASSYNSLGEIWLYGQSDLSADTVSLDLAPVQGDYRLIFSAAVDTVGFELELAINQQFSSLPSIELYPELGSKREYAVSSMSSVYTASVSDSIGEAGTLRMGAEDASSNPFFVDCHYVITSSSADRFNKIIGPGGQIVVSIDSVNSGIEKTLILSSQFPIIRTGLDDNALQAGQTHSISSYPQAGLSGTNQITIAYAQSDLTITSNIVGDEASLEIYYWNDDLLHWERIGGIVDTLENTVAATVTTTGVYAAFTTNIITAVEDDNLGDLLPYQFKLSQNYPNPFNPVTTIEYSLPERSHVTIEVHNVLGQRVRTLVDREESAGSYTVTWNGADESGRSVATGVYLYRFQAGDHVETKKMLLLK